MIDDEWHLRRGCNRVTKRQKGWHIKARAREVQCAMCMARATRFPWERREHRRRLYVESRARSGWECSIGASWKHIHICYNEDHITWDLPYHDTLCFFYMCGDTRNKFAHIACGGERSSQAFTCISLNHLLYLVVTHFQKCLVSKQSCILGFQFRNLPIM